MQHALQYGLLQIKIWHRSEFVNLIREHLVLVIDFHTCYMLLAIHVHDFLVKTVWISYGFKLLYLCVVLRSFSYFKRVWPCGCLGRSIELLQIYIIDKFQDQKQAILPNIFVPFFAVQYHGRNNFCHI